MFEKQPWITTVKELFPYETLEINYPVDKLEGSILVEVTSETYSKIFSKTLKYAPKEKK